MWAISDLENLFYHLRVVKWYADVIIMDKDTILARQSEYDEWHTLSIASEMNEMVEYQNETSQKYGW